MMVSKLGRISSNWIIEFSSWRYRLSPSILRARLFSIDRFQFFREPSAELWRYIERENQRSLQLIDSNLRVAIEREIQTQSQVSIPELGPCGRHYYSSSVGSDNCLRYSKSIDAEGNEGHEILNLNLNTYELRAMSLSVDETLLAYLIVSVQTSETHLWVKDLQKHTIRLVPTKGENLSLVEWGPLQRNGGHSLFFTSMDAWRRPSRVFACVLGDDYLSEPALVYHNSDDSVIVDVQRSKGCRFIAISATTKVSNEIHLMSDVAQPPLLVRARQQGVQYHLDVGADGDVYLLVSADRSNHECGLDEELTLFRASINELPLRSGFGAFVAGRSDEFVISDMDIFRDAVVLYERSSVDGSQRIRVKGCSCESVAHVPDQLNPCGNMFYDAKVVQFTVESPVHEPVLYEYDFRDNILSTSQQGTSTKDSGSDKYAYVPVLVPSHDGVQVPMSIFHRSDVDPVGPENRVVLVGYGAYGEPVTRGFDSSALSLINRGVVVAYAHTRGGGELGKSWYHAGRLYNKGNAVEDYLACAQSLVDSMVEPTRLTAKAFSAGGVTVGAAINRSPTLFASAVFVNAFLDVTTSMYNKMALTDHEYDEWGDPTVDKLAAETIAAICPFANRNANDKEHFPSTLVVGTLDDANVPFWHALTYHAKLSGRHLLYMLPQGGHHMHGASLDVAALTNSFIIKPPTL